MLVLGGHNNLGNVLHVVMGPESELHQDIHGATILDVTPLLSVMNGQERIFLSVTRCRSEQLSSHVMTTANLKYLNSFSVPDAAAGKPVPIAKPAKQVPCQCCGATIPLLGVPGFNICASCAAIELNRRKPVKVKGA